jgi:hypothetical protein
MEMQMTIRFWIQQFVTVSTVLLAIRSAEAQIPFPIQQFQPVPIPYYYPVPVPYYQPFQVPVYQTFGGRFSTVVPDRGTVFLGGISRAGRSYSRGGCGCLSRPGVGMYVESAGLSASAWIHDLREMDRMVLDAADSPEAAARLRESGLVDDSSTASRFRQPAFRDEVVSRRERSMTPAGTVLMSHESRRLIARSRSLRESSSLGASARSSSESNIDDELPRVVIVNRSAATKWYRLGKAAEDSGNPGAAKVHYRQAARYGSTLALNRLKELSE